MTEHPSLFRRLPAIYQERDAEPDSQGQFEAYIGLMDEVLNAIDADIEAFYHDHFIETCDDWVIPYIGDLLGVSHLKGDSWTLRADVARTVALRRRKGTLGAVEQLAFALTGWAAHAVEMRERMVWDQHLNHLRPDRGGLPFPAPHHIAHPVPHGTVNLRDPGVPSFLGSAFDPFARVADVKPTRGVQPRPNLPNLAVFLWRLKDYQVPVAAPVRVGTVGQPATNPGDAPVAARFVIHPLGRQMRLFNTFRFDERDPRRLALPDRTPGPMPAARLDDGPPTGNPAEYIAVDIYAGGRPDDPGADAVGLIIHLPANPFAGTAWTTRGANLCAWEDSISRPLQTREIVVDPIHGRLLLGIEDNARERRALGRLRVSATTGAPGPTGAHPVARPPTVAIWQEQATEVRRVTAHPGGTSLRTALSGLSDAGPPVIVEIADSMTHQLNLSDIDDIGDEGGKPTIRLARPLWIRALSGQRPVIILRQPLRLRPVDVTGPDAETLTRTLDVRLEGLFITVRNAPTAGRAIVEQAAVNRLTLDGVTLDPAGHVALDGTDAGTRQPPQAAFALDNRFGFADASESADFAERPAIVLKRCITGPIRIDDAYTLEATDSIIDGGSGVGDPTPRLAISALDDPETDWGPDMRFSGVTVFGRARLKAADGTGGIWVHALRVRDHQSGCLSHSYLRGVGDRLPPHHASIFGTSAPLAFTSHVFGTPGYGQLARVRADRRLHDEGPNADQMGAFGYLLNTHRWKNLSIRLREFTPVGVTPVLATVT
jgi:hypothetical protein